MDGEVLHLSAVREQSLRVVDHFRVAARDRERDERDQLSVLKLIVNGSRMPLPIRIIALTVVQLTSLLAHYLCAAHYELTGLVAYMH